MRWMDCLLLSTALGATLFTGYVFAVRPLDRDTIHAERADVEFKVAVVHESSQCARVKESAGGALPCHFLITATGDIIPTAAWKTRSILRTTRVPRVDEAAISVVLESGPTRALQREALQRLLETLRDRDGITLTYVYQHAQVESGGCSVARAP